MLKEPVLEIENLSFRYKRDRYLYKDFSLKVYKGECIGVVGASGSGKSTLFELIANNLKPEKGKIKVKQNRLDFSRPLQLISHFILYLKTDKRCGRRD